MWSSLLTTVVGVILGAILTQQVSKRAQAQQVAERQEERQQRLQSIYLLIYLEIEHNRALLDGMWGEFTEGTGVSPADENDLKMVRASVLAGQHLPQWATVMWQSNASQIAEVLSATQIVDALDFYAWLDCLSRIHVEMRRIATNLADANADELINLHGNSKVGANIRATSALGSLVVQFEEFESVALDVINAHPLAKPKAIK